MIRAAHVSLKFKRYPIADKIAFGNTVYNGINGNPTVFLNPTVLPSALKTANNGLNAAALAAAGGNHSLVSAMYNAEKAWIKVFGSEALYIEGLAQGSENIIRMSGYKTTTSEFTNIDVPPVVVIKKIKTNDAVGSFSIQLATMNRFRVSGFIYVVSTVGQLPVFRQGQLMPADNPNMIAVKIDTHRKVDFHNLTGSSILYVSVAAFNTAGIGVPSQPIVVKVFLD